MNFFQSNFFKRTLTFLLGLSTLAGLYSFEPAAFNLLFIAVFLWIAALELPYLLSTKTVWYWVALIFYLGFPLMLFFNLYQNKTTQPLALWTFAVTLVHDATAYCVGKLFGKHLLAPKLSPKKTWQGCFGGFMGLLYFISVTTQLTIPILLVITAILSFLCIVGDLFESWLKRNAGIKDSGKLLPGHGGLLDRIDAVLFVIPFVYYYQQLFLKALL